MGKRGVRWPFMDVFAGLHELPDSAAASLRWLSASSSGQNEEMSSYHHFIVRYFAHVGFLYTEIAHAGQFLLYRSVNSAVLLMIPYMVYFLWLLAENRCISVKYIVKYASLLWIRLIIVFYRIGTCHFSFYVIGVFVFAKDRVEALRGKMIDRIFYMDNFIFRHSGDST